MQPLRITNATRRMAKDQDEYQTLDIIDGQTDEGDPVMTSLWMPTPEERELLLAGQPVFLNIMGTVHPPVFLEVPDTSAARKEPDEADEEE